MCFLAQKFIFRYILMIEAVKRGNNNLMGFAFFELKFCLGQAAQRRDDVAKRTLTLSNEEEKRWRKNQRLSI